MEAFSHFGRYRDPASQLIYQWKSLSNPSDFTTSIDMRVSGFDRTSTIISRFNDDEMTAMGEDACVREAMKLAEREFGLPSWRPESQENTRGVLHHLVQMARELVA